MYVCLSYLNYYLAVGLNGTNKPARHYNLAGHIAYCYYRCQQNTGYIDTCPGPNNAQNDPPKSAFHRNVAQFALEYNTLTKHSLSFCSQYSVHQFSLAIKYSRPRKILSSVQRPHWAWKHTQVLQWLSQIGKYTLHKFQTRDFLV